MGKRLLDIATGVGLAVMGLIVAIAVWGRRTPKVNGDRYEYDSHSSYRGHDPPDPIVSAGLPVEAEIQKPASTGPQQPKNKQDDEKFSLRRTITNWAFWTAVATGLLAGYSIKQFNLVSANGERQLRAYLLASYAELKKPDEGENEVSEVSVAFKNSGQTPAYDVVVDAKFTYEDHTDPTATKEAVARTDQPRPHNVGAQEPTWIDDTPTPEDIAKLKAGKLLIRVSGIATYRDVFDKPHHIEFSFYSDLDKRSKPHHFLVSPYGNKIVD